MPGKRSLFEHDVCGRCGGTGHHSRCEMYGTICFGCAGSGWKLTKRGRAAQDFLNARRMVPAETIRVGDLLWCEGMAKAAFCRVTAVTVKTPAEHGHKTMIDGQWIATPTDAVVIECDTTGKSSDIPGGIGTWRGEMVRKGQTGEQKAADREAALAYQATLTKAGKPAKAKG
jgi:hypothetical protein